MLRSGSASELVLIDFSLAILKAPDESVYSRSRAVGTLPYMSAEGALGYALPASDIHSLAKILLEMLTGRTLDELLPQTPLQHAAQAREVLHHLSFQLPEPSIDLLAAALEFHPFSRPQDVRAFAERVACDLEASAS